MKNWHKIFIPLVFVFAFIFAVTGNNLVYADDHGDRYEYYGQYDKYENDKGYGEHRDGKKEKDGPYEELGETLGWGTVIAMGAAGVIFILRRSMKTVITRFPDAKNIFVSISRFFGKYHIGIGIVALVLSITHGVLMFLNEGRLDKDGIIGLGSVIFMAIASVLGAVLAKKKKVKSVRLTHTIFIVLAIVIALIHVVGA